MEKAWLAGYAGMFDVAQICAKQPLSRSTDCRFNNTDAIYLKNLRILSFVHYLLVSLDKVNNEKHTFQL